MPGIRTHVRFALLFACTAIALAATCSSEPGDSGSTAAPPTSTIEQPLDSAVSATATNPARSGAPAPDVTVPDAPYMTAIEGDAPYDRHTSGATPNAGGGNDNDNDAIDSGIEAVTPTPTARTGIPPNETIVALPTATPTPTPGGGSPMIGGCPIMPPNNAWNTDISNYPVHPNSAGFLSGIASTGGNQFLHADFGGGGEYGIPFIVVPQNQPMVAINFTDYGDESDPGPYPIPLNAPIEGGSDRHVLAIQQGTCMLYELFHAFPQANRWDASSGAIWNLNSNALRPEGWTSADAAGLPVVPGLAKYDEVAAGAVRHAVRFSVQRSQRGYVHPATHFASSYTDPNYPPMGLRLRLKASFNTSGFTGQSRVILEGLKKYGMMLADNGSNWYITGASDPRWDDEDLNQLKTVPGSAFEVVNTGPIITP